MRKQTDIEVSSATAAGGLRAPPLALWVLLRHHNEGPSRLGCRLRSCQWVAPRFRAAWHFPDEGMPAELANMETHTARASDCGYGGIKAGSKAEQLSRSAYVEDEAGTLMGRVSMSEEPTRSHAEDDYPCSHIDTPLSLRFFFEAIRRPAISMSDRQHTLLRAQAATGG